MTKNNMSEDRIQNFNNHMKTPADIGRAILEHQDKVLAEPGAREIIAMYLFIPYMTKATLETPCEECKIPKINLDQMFVRDASVKNLRDTICHSPVSVEKGGMMILDDRCICDEKSHSKKGRHSSAIKMDITEVHNRLLELFNKILSDSTDQ